MRLRIGAACAAVSAILGAALSPAAAETMTTPVLNTVIKGMPDTEANIVVFDIDPGWKTEHHIHPGQLFVYILEGGLRLEIDGRDPVEYSAGEAFYEEPNLGMVGSNVSATERAKFVVFQFGETGQPLMVAQ